MLRLPPIHTIDRLSGQTETEEVYGEASLSLLYRTGPLGKLLRAPLTRLSLFSRFYGWLQKRRRTAKKVQPFIERYGLDPEEFVKRVSDFSSFNDFFVREIKSQCRPHATAGRLICPADGRYQVIRPLSQDLRLAVKSRKKLTISELLGSASLADRYEEGQLIAIRLCPLDCHRFYFPCSGYAKQARLINGYLRSVNPVALKENLQTFVQNKRFVTEIESDAFGKVLMIEVGATAVGSISQTFTPNARVERGEEKGYFSFGGSAILLLLERDAVRLDKDLFHPLEVRCLIGQSLGTSWL